MTLLTALLLLILFLAFFIYFSGLNPNDITLILFADHQITTSVTIMVVGCILIGLTLGFMVHLYHTLTHQLKHWKSNRREKKAKEVNTIYREGVGRLLSGDLKKAHTLLQKALDRDPSRVEIYLAMANVHIQEGDAHQGIALLLKAKEIAPQSLEVLFKLANTYEDINGIAEACKIYEEILSIENSNRKALRNLRDLHIKESKWQNALDLQKRILKSVQGSARVEAEKEKNLALRFEVAHQDLVNGQIDNAISAFKEIIKESPSFTPARVSLGDAYKQQGRAEDASQVWQDGYKKLGKSIFLSRLEELYLTAEDPAALISFYRSTIMERDKDLMLRLFFGKLCLRLEMVDDAMEQLFAVENTGADFPQLHLLLAETHRRRNRIDEAIEEYKKALGVNGRLDLGLVCEQCGATSSEWLSRCKDCGTWGSLVLVDRNLLKNVQPVEVREIHHGERA